MEYLEWIANTDAPPLNYGTIERLKNDMDTMKMTLQSMEDAFCKPGNLLSWTLLLLDEIDECFCKHYLDGDGGPVPSLFFPNSIDNMNIFMTYCGDVDQAIRKHAEGTPPYVHKYFLYYTIWQMRPKAWPGGQG